MPQPSDCYSILSSPSPAVPFLAQQVRVLHVSDTISLHDIGTLLSSACIGQLRPVCKLPSHGGFADAIFDLIEWDPRAYSTRTHFESYRNFKVMHQFPQFWKIVPQHTKMNL